MDEVYETDPESAAAAAELLRSAPVPLHRPQAARRRPWPELAA